MPPGFQVSIERQAGASRWGNRPGGQGSRPGPYSNGYNLTRGEKQRLLPDGPQESECSNSSCLTPQVKATLAEKEGGRECKGICAFDTECG